MSTQPELSHSWHATHQKLCVSDRAEPLVVVTAVDWASQRAASRCGCSSCGDDSSCVIDSWVVSAVVSPAGCVMRSTASAMAGSSARRGSWPRASVVSGSWIVSAAVLPAVCIVWIVTGAGVEAGGSVGGGDMEPRTVATCGECVTPPLRPPASCQAVPCAASSSMKAVAAQRTASGSMAASMMRVAYPRPYRCRSESS